MVAVGEGLVTEARGVGSQGASGTTTAESTEPRRLEASPWFVRDFPHGEGMRSAQRASRGEHSPAGWCTATVPGLATADFERHGRIPNPFYGDQALAARFIEERDFVYRTRFVCSESEAGAHARLIFESLDTFATIFLNGLELARHENQFRRLFVDVTGHLVEGENDLAVSFEASWPATVRRAGPARPHWNPPAERLYVRKSQMSFGWDWATRVPTVGIPGHVFLDVSRGAFAGDLWVRGQPAGSGGHLVACLDYLPHETFDAEVELWVDGEEAVRERVALYAGHAHSITLSNTMTTARRWQPHEMGPRSLYDVEVRLVREAKVLSVRRARSGLVRTELVRGDRSKRKFALSVNGRELFCKGENWIPLDLMHPRTSDEELREYLALLAGAGVNLVRVWGGGIVERQAFYDACDDLGLLVWQDFPFACGLYPETPELTEEVRCEAVDIVRRLRNHPCLALWCGNNENETLAESVGEKPRRNLFYEVLPGVVAEEDPERPYWPGSPASESPGVPPNSPHEGDHHGWDVWFGWKSADAPVTASCFCSEVGAQAFPQRESLESFLAVEDLWSVGNVSAPSGPSPGLQFARHGAQLEKLFARASSYADLRDLDTVIAATQAFQADVIGRAIRSHRRYGAGGIILWNYTSTWPSICWALIDWYRRPKQAFYEARRAFQPVVVGIEPNPSIVRCFDAFVSTATPEPIEGTLVLSLLETTSGREVLRSDAHVVLGGWDPPCVVSLELPDECDSRRHALVATFAESRARGQSAARDVRYLAPLREVEFGKGTVTARWDDRGIKLRAEVWCPRVGVESYEAPVVWSDDYFDLLPGEERSLEPSGPTPEHVWVVAGMGRRKRLLPGSEVHL